MISLFLLLAALVFGPGFAASMLLSTPAPPVSNHSPAVSPDGSRIAFLSDRDGATNVWLISPDGTGEKQLTKTSEAKNRPGWSADSRQVWFAVIEKESGRVYAMDLSGQNLGQLAAVPGQGVVLSPDARRVLYWTGNWNANRLAVSDVDGANPQQLTDGTSVAWNLRWSPDGKRIAFSGKDGAGVLHVFVMNSDGSGLRQLTHLPSEEGRAQVPDWSADGKQIAFQANYAQTCHIWIADVTTGDARKLAAHTAAYLDEVPAWFPDGKRIAFQSNRTGRMEIWVMNADGTDPHQVTR